MNHAQKRALTRFGTEMTRLDEAEIMARIQRGQGKRLHIGPGGADNSRAEQWRVFWPKLGRDIVVVYLVKHMEIATVLPNNHYRRSGNTPRYREVEDTDEPMEVNDNAPVEDVDFDALADVKLRSLAPTIHNPLMAERLKEAGLIG